MESVIDLYSRLFSSSADERKRLMHDYFTAVSYSEAHFRIVKSCKAGKEGDFCVVESPNSYIEEENDPPGFLAKNLSNDDLFQVEFEPSEEQRKISKEFEFVILTWEEFLESFVPVESSEVWIAKRSDSLDDDDLVVRDRPSEERHALMMLCALVCAVAGILIVMIGIARSEGGLVLVGVSMCTVFVLGLVVSRGWKRVNRMRTGKKIVSVLPAVLGGMVGFVIILSLAALWMLSRQQSVRSTHR